MCIYINFNAYKINDNIEFECIGISYDYHEFNDVALKLDEVYHYKNATSFQFEMKFSTKEIQDNIISDIMNITKVQKIASEYLESIYKILIHKMINHENN